MWPGTTPRVRPLSRDDKTQSFGIRMSYSGKRRPVRIVHACIWLIACVLYGLLFREWWTSPYDWTYDFEGVLILWSPALLAAAASIVFSVGKSIAGLAQTRTPVERGGTKSWRPTQSSHSPTSVVLASGVLACVLVLCAAAVRRVIRVLDRSELASGSFEMMGAAAGLAVLCGFATFCAELARPGLLSRAQEQGAALLASARRSPTPLAIVAATFALSIYSAEVWLALGGTPWFTVVSIGLALAWASAHRTSPNARSKGTAGLASAAEPANRVDANIGRPRGLLGATVSSLFVVVAFAIIALNLVPPEAVAAWSLEPQGFSQCRSRESDCVPEGYLETILKIAVLLGSLATFVESGASRNAPSKALRESLDPRLRSSRPM